MGLIVLIGVVLVAFSRNERLHPSNAANGVSPTTTDHWQEAVAFDMCGTVEPTLPANTNESTAGIYTAGDGNIHVQPRNSSTTGHKATLGAFVGLYPGMSLSADEVQYPGKREYHNGDKCGSKAGLVQVKVWDSPTSTTGHVLSGDPGDLLLENGQLITIAFLPSGASIPKPPGADITNLLDNMNASAQDAGNSTRVTLPPTVTTVGSGATSQTVKPTGATPTTTPATVTTPSSTTPTTTAKSSTTTKAP